MHPSRLLVFYAFVVWTTVLFACGTYTGSIKRRSLLVTMMKAAGDNLQHDKGVCLMAKKITDTVTWVGKVDWELNEFHGHEYSTETRWITKKKYGKCSISMEKTDKE